MRHPWFDHLRLPARVLILVAPALVGGALIAAVLLCHLYGDAAELRQAARRSGIFGTLATAIQRIQHEQAEAIAALSIPGAIPRSVRQAGRDATDQALARLRDVVPPGHAPLLPLAEIRRHIDAGGIGPVEAMDALDGTVAGLLDLRVEQAAAITAGPAIRSAFAGHYVMKAIEAAGHEAALGALALAAGHLWPADHAALARSLDEQARYVRLFVPFASAPERATLAAALADPAEHELHELRALLRIAAERDPPPAAAGRWRDVAGRRLDRLHAAGQAIAQQGEALARAEADAARDMFVGSLLGTTLAGGIVVVTATLAGRSLARPLDRMTRTMSALASGTLDVTVEDAGRRDEIGAMARAVEVFRAHAILRQEREAELAHMARHDLLTGLPNRLAFQDRLQHALLMVARGGIATIMCVHVGGLKDLADSHGHAAVDRLICLLAERLKACLRETDTVAALDREEFAAVQIGLSRAEDAGILVRRVLQALSAPAALGSTTVAPRIRIGVSLGPPDGTDPDRLLRCAGAALERAKAEGGRAYRFFEPEMERKLQARLQLESMLTEALAGDGLQLLYQPVVDTGRREVRLFEALVRLNHPVQGRIAPGEFIPVAEETGLILPLGEWILARACRDAASWLHPARIAVNLSVMQFRDPELAAKIETILNETGLPAARLVLEITESVFLHDDARTLGVLHQLRRLGIGISLDDFGTGFSSLGYLRRFPFDTIKIDQSFVRDLGRVEGATAIVRAIIMLGASFNMAVVAEGVETQAQRVRLQNEGCWLMQGYLFGRPDTAAQAASLVPPGGPAPLLALSAG